MKPRPRVQAAPTTWLVLLVVGGTLGWLQFDNRFPAVRYEVSLGYPRSWQVPYKNNDHAYGWPFIVCAFVPTRICWPTVAVANAIFLLLMLLSCSFVVERFSRQERRWQLQTRSLFIVTTVAAACMLVVKNERLIISWAMNHWSLLWQISDSPFPPDNPFLRVWQALVYVDCEDIKHQPWPTFLVIMFALGCTIYTLSWLALRAAVRMFHVGRRHMTRASLRG